MQVTDKEITKADANSGVDIRNAINAIFKAINTQNSGNSEPLNPEPFMPWVDTSNSAYYYLKYRTADNSAWNTIIRYKVSDKTVDFMLSGSALSDLLSTKADAAAVVDAFALKVSKDSNTGVAFLPFGTTAQRPTLTSNDRAIRYNTTLSAWESWDGTSWGLLGGGVALTGNQTKDGVLTFTSSPIIPVPTSINQAIPMGAILEKTGVGIGYGTGSGGTVTQPTNKGTNITLNKPCGQITMNNSAIASGGYAYFQMSNSTIGAGDTVIAELVAGAADPSYYEVIPFFIGSGYVRIKVKNVSGGSLSEALIINFAVIKGATA